MVILNNIWAVLNLSRVLRLKIHQKTKKVAEGSYLSGIYSGGYGYTKGAYTQSAYIRSL